MLNNEKFPKRKPTRLQYFDYSNVGVYFITICTEGHRPILSSIIESEEAVVALTPYGEITDKKINELSLRYKNLELINYVIMPNHIHLLLGIFESDSADIIASGGRGNPSPTIASMIGWLEFAITKEINA